jgi:hypothetical protein
VAISLALQSPLSFTARRLTAAMLWRLNDGMSARTQNENPASMPAFPLPPAAPRVPQRPRALAEMAKAALVNVVLSNDPEIDLS